MKYKLGELQENGLYRIIALKDFADVHIGDVGGFIQSEANLSQEGNCWIYNDACAKDFSLVKDDATLHNVSILADTSVISDTSKLTGHAIVTGRSVIRNDSSVNDRVVLRNYTLINFHFHGGYTGSNNDLRNGVHGLDDEVHYEYNGIDAPCGRILNGYHSQSDKDFSEGADIRVGFEIERDEYLTITQCKLLKERGWKCERDGSVRGGEYITPILDLNKAYTFIEESEFVLNGANNSKRCGGHIHLSIKNKQPVDIYNNINYFRQILWGLYPERCLSRYSNKNRSRTDHYADVCLRNHTIEFRIFPILKTLNQVRFRLALLRFFITNVGDTKEHALEVINSKSIEFLSILHIAYPTIRKKLSILKRIMKAYEIDETREKDIVSFLQKQCEELKKA